MIKSSQITQVKDLLQSAKSIFVMIDSQAQYDQLASALSLFFSFADSEQHIDLISPLEIDKNKVDLIGLDEIKTKIGNKDLSISFDYSEEAVDKVSYHIGEKSNKFYLVIKPRKGHKPLDTSTIEYEYTGAQADLIFLIGVSKLDDLKSLYYGYEQLYKDSSIVSINTIDPGYNAIKLNISGISSYCEATARLIRELGLDINSDSATNLYSGIYKATEGFSSLSATADTFATISELIRLGARRSKSKSSQQASTKTHNRKSSKLFSKNNKPSSLGIKKSGGSNIFNKG